MNRRRLLGGLAAGALVPVLSGSALRPLDLGQSRVRLTIADGPLGISHDAIQRWVLACCEAVMHWFGRFPVHPLELTVKPGRGEGVYGGYTLGGELPKIRVTVGERATVEQLYSDWILVHELVHLAWPNVPRRHHWIEEGLATYVEPWVRIPAGQITAEQAWYDLVVGLPQGQPGPNDAGLDHTATWGRTYWGGALYHFLVDLELRRANADIGLKQALVGILAAGGSMHVSWPLERVLAAGDAAAGSTALTRTWEAHRAAAVRTDLDAIWSSLGVIARGRAVQFDDAAPEAALRRAIDGTTRH